MTAGTMPHPTVVRSWERIAEYERLTREHGLSAKDACARLGITKRTGTRYDQIIRTRTGVDLLTARRRIYRELRTVMGRHAAAHLLSIHPNTARSWDRALAKD